jgi:hypothetical protein
MVIYVSLNLSSDNIVLVNCLSKPGVETGLIENLSGEIQIDNTQRNDS